MMSLQFPKNILNVQKLKTDGKEYDRKRNFHFFRQKNMNKLMSSWHEVSAPGSQVGRIKIPVCFRKLWQGG